MPSLTVGLVGLGYVGLPLAVRCLDAGHQVRGFDLDSHKKAASTEYVKRHAKRPMDAIGNFLPSDNPQVLAEAQVIIICVPTPLKKGRPDYSHLKEAAATVAKVMSPGALVVLESTTSPGTTEDMLWPELDKGHRKVDRDYFLAYSPERINPGADEHEIFRVPKVVSGVTHSSATRAMEFYETIFEKVVKASSTKTAEATKLFENSFRLINIAFVNEFARACYSIGVSANEVVQLASSKPFGFMRFDPGLGAGGHCIPVDPTYLTDHLAKIQGHQIDLLKQATESNRAQPAYIVSWILQFLMKTGHPTTELSFGLVGMSYKADVPDLRESMSVELSSILERRGHRVFEFDQFQSESRQMLSIGELNQSSKAEINVWIVAQPLTGIFNPTTLLFFEREIDKGVPVFDLTGRIPLEGCVVL